MSELKVVEHKPKQRLNEDKVQIQLKNKSYSRSFTVYGMTIDYLFEQYFTITKKLAESESDNIKIICYKPKK